MNRCEDQDDPFGSIAIPGDRTIATVSPDPVWDGRFGVVISHDKIQQEEATKDAWNTDGVELVRVRKTPRGPVPDWRPVAVAVPEEPEPVAMDLEELEEQQEAQQPEGEPPQELEQAYALEFIHEGVQYSQASALRALRQLCREYGLSKNGSKAEILKRLSVAVQESSLRQRVQASQEHIEIMLNRFSWRLWRNLPRKRLIFAG